MRRNFKPDYFVNETILEITNSFKEDMYSLTPERARILFSLGIPIYVLDENEFKSKIFHIEEIEDLNNCYAIFKDAWNMYLKSKDDEDFVDCWWFISDQAQHLKGDRIISLGGVCTDEEYELIYCEETNHMEEFFEERDDEPFTYDAYSDKIQKYIFPITYEYSGRLYEMFKKTGVEVNRTKFYLELLNRVTTKLLEFGK